MAADRDVRIDDRPAVVASGGSARERPDLDVDDVGGQATRPDHDVHVVDPGRRHPLPYMDLAVRYPGRGRRWPPGMASAGRQRLGREWDRGTDDDESGGGPRDAERTHPSEVGPRLPALDITRQALDACINASTTC